MHGILKEIINGAQLPEEAAYNVMEGILNDQLPASFIGAMLTAYHFRTPSAGELYGFARALKTHTITLALDDELSKKAMDVCGTGGDGKGTFNVSTTVALAVAAAGVPVAKHGNRAVSSKSGSFDVLEALGVPFADSPTVAQKALCEFGIAFLYAPAFQPAFRKFAPIRQTLGFRTILNAIGPLLNPARVQRQLIGVYSRDLILPMAETLGKLGVHSAMVVHGDDGSDELSVCAPSTVAHVNNGKISIFRVTPEEFGLPRANLKNVQGDLPLRNAQILRSVLAGERGAPRDIVVFNGAAALVVAGVVGDIREGIERIAQVLDNGSATALLDEIRVRVPLGELYELSR